jgi:hypothetical protein
MKHRAFHFKGTSHYVILLKFMFRHNNKNVSNISPTVLFMRCISGSLCTFSFEIPEYVTQIFCDTYDYINTMYL